MKESTDNFLKILSFNDYKNQIIYHKNKIDHLSAKYSLDTEEIEKLFFKLVIPPSITTVTEIYQILEKQLQVKSPFAEFGKKLESFGKQNNETTQSMDSLRNWFGKNQK